tara:strand:+ start:17429 stop:18499 length:1071 start_codon:yes stop_codon:yes gene_type:complete
MNTKKNNKLTFGLLGLGTVVNLRIYKLLKNELSDKVKVISVFDKNKKKNIDYSNRFNCKLNENEKNFFLSNFKYCYISTPSGSHYKDILKCFKYHKHVVVEKPPVLKVSELLKLNKIAIKKKLHFFVIYQNRENKAVKFVKNFLQKNKKEKKVLVNLNLLWSRPQGYYSGWHGKWKHDGGVIAQQGIHYIDLLCYLFGKPIRAISTISNVSNKLQAEDTHIGMIKFKDVTCTIGLSTALRPSDFKASIDIICQNKILSLSGIACNKVEIFEFGNNKNKKLIKDCKKNSQKVKSGVGISHYQCFNKIIKSYYNKKVKPLRAIDTIETLKLINMLYLSSYKNKWVLNNRKIISSKLGN